MNEVKKFASNLKKVMGWSDDTITFNGNVVTVKYGMKNQSQDLAGYNFAYQVKLLMDMVDGVGFFE